MSPRSILKRSSQQTATAHSPSHGVHFPPSPSLCSTFSAYSPAAYDRSPIVVSRNACALPERGCPGRTYVLDESGSPSTSSSRSSQTSSSRSRSVHPRALAMTELPQLIPDCSSESDESDSSPIYPASVYNTGYNTGYNTYDPSTLAFLPHPHVDGSAKPRRKSSDGSSKRREPERIRAYDSSAASFGTSDASSSPSSTDEEYSTPSPAARRKRSSFAHAHSPSNTSFSSFSMYSLKDDGCLGGF